MYVCKHSAHQIEMFRSDAPVTALTDGFINFSSVQHPLRNKPFYVSSGNNNQAKEGVLFFASF